VATRFLENSYTCGLCDVVFVWPCLMDLWGFCVNRFAHVDRCSVCCSRTHQL